MILYLYALAQGLTEQAGVVGHDDQPIVLLPFNSVIVAASRLAAAPAITKDALTRQDQVVRALHARAHALLPMRFGSMVADDAAAAVSIEKFGHGLTDRLAKVAGCEQMTLRIFAAGAGTEAGGREPGAIADIAETGTSYLASRAALSDPPPEVRALLDAVRTLQRGVRVEKTKRADAWTIYHLVDRGAGAEYRQVAEAAAAAIPLRVLVSGPSPAYAF